MIELKQVTKTYFRGQGSMQMTVRAVEQVEMTIQAGEFVVITGRSGCGKTTLLNLIAGLARPDSGKVIFEGIELLRGHMPTMADGGAEEEKAPLSAAQLRRRVEELEMIESVLAEGEEVQPQSKRRILKTASDL